MEDRRWVGGLALENPSKAPRGLTDLRRQLSDGVFGEVEDGKLSEASQVVGQLLDLGPADVPLSQVGHPLQLSGEVLHRDPAQHRSAAHR